MPIVIIVVVKDLWSEDKDNNLRSEDQEHEDKDLSVCKLDNSW